MGISTDDYYAREADRIARGPQLYGGNADIVKLRCFKYYHPDQGSWLTNPEGLSKWVGPKTARIYAILHRSGSVSSRTTMSAISSEAMCSRSTVSRAIVKLQAFGFLVADVTRGRNGGVVVRLREKSDGLRHCAAAAWKRIRSWINVASRSREGEVGTQSTGTSMDATFTEDAAIERLGARVLAGEIGVDTLSALNGRDRRRAREEDQQQERYRSWAAQVIAERQWLDANEPDWDYADLR